MEDGSLITPLQPEDIESAVDLHMRYLTERLSGEPGRRLLRLFYAALCQGSKGVCLVCRDESGNNLDGMVVLRWNGRRLLWDLLRQHPVEVGFWLACHILQNPLSLYPLARQLWERRPVNNLLRGFPDNPHYCILHALIVVPNRQLGGVGNRLIQAAFSYALAHGFKYMFTSTYETNQTADHLYEKVGFKLLLTTSERGRIVKWYGRHL